jgi:hypothetical protein
MVWAKTADMWAEWGRDGGENGDRRFGDMVARGGFTERIGLREERSVAKPRGLVIISSRRRG